MEQPNNPHPPQPYDEAPARDPRRVYVDFASDGGMQISRGGESATFENPKVVQKRTAEMLSTAGARLARLRGESGTPEPEIVKIELPADDQPWFIRRLDLEAVTRVGIYGGRDSRGALTLHENGSFYRFADRVSIRWRLSRKW